MQRNSASLPADQNLLTVDVFQPFYRVFHLLTRSVSICQMYCCVHHFKWRVTASSYNKKQNTIVSQRPKLRQLHGYTRNLQRVSTYYINSHEVSRRQKVNQPGCFPASNPNAFTLYSFYHISGYYYPPSYAMLYSALYS